MSPDAATTAYENYLASLNLRHFRPWEVTRFQLNAKKGVSNSLPPQKLCKALAPTLAVVDELRARLDVPIKITSAYRNPKYNAKIGGVSDSQHTKNTALDISSPVAGPRTIHNELLKMRREGLFTGGLGRYGTFVHVDTRGKNADWTG